MNIRERLIMHLDGDAFFVAVESAKDPSLRGRPVVTGQERGIASALSYEAKALGITRAMPIFQIRREFPQVRVVNSDYEAYATFSRRMFDIVRRYTDAVEEYSIDECFADFTDIPGFAGDPRPTLERIKAEILRELGISVSLGLGPTKVIAKTASKCQKPGGLTIVPVRDAPMLLDKTHIGSVWGIGSATGFALRRKGVSTALELARKPLSWVEEHFSKPMAEMWHELNGVSVHSVRRGPEEAQKSIMKTRTFSPVSKNRAYVFSQLSKNIENACRKSRELGLVAREFSVYLKTSEFSYARESARLEAPSNDSILFIREAKKLFVRIFDPRIAYRATGVTLSGLLPASERQEDLFGVVEIEREQSKVWKTVDALNKKYGKSLIHIASSSQSMRKEGKGNGRQLSVPFLGDAF